MPTVSLLETIAHHRNVSLNVCEVSSDQVPLLNSQSESFCASSVLFLTFVESIYVLTGVNEHFCGSIRERIEADLEHLVSAEFINDVYASLVALFFIALVRLFS